MAKALGVTFFLILLLLTSNIVSADVTIDARTNDYRAANNLTALRTDATLTSIAAGRVQQLKLPLTHATGQWIYDSMGCWNWAGENIAWSGYDNNDFAEDWYNSAGHRANMLDPRFDAQGSAVRYDATTDIYFAVQIFRDSCGSQPAPEPQQPTPQPAPESEPTTNSGGTDSQGTSGTGNAPVTGQSTPTGISQSQEPVPLLPDTSTLGGSKNR